MTGIVVWVKWRTTARIDETRGHDYLLSRRFFVMLCQLDLNYLIFT